MKPLSIALDEVLRLLAELLEIGAERADLLEAIEATGGLRGRVRPEQEKASRRLEALDARAAEIRKALGL